MNAKIVIAMCLLVCGASAFSPRTLGNTPMNAHQMILEVMLKSMEAGVRIDAAETAACFQTASDKSTEITATFQREYGICQATAVAEKALASSESAASRASLQGEGADVCKKLSECDTENDAVAFFSCYNKASAQGSSSLLELSGKSNSEFLVYTAKYKVIDDALNMCCSKAENIYRTDNAKNSEDLSKCLNGEN